MNDKTDLLQQLQIDRSQPVEKKSIKLWQFFLFGLACAALSFWLASALQKPTPSTTPTTPATVTAVPSTAKKTTLATAPADSKKDEAILNASGYITARRMATVSAEIMGLITEVNVEEGMQVTQGQVLAKLDSALATTNLNHARTQVEALVASRKAIAANLNEARRNHQRVNENSFSSDAQKSQAQAQLENLTAQLESAKANIESAKIDVIRQQERLDDHTIRAPFAGVVTVKNAQTGEIVAPAAAGGGFTRTGICTIVDMSSLEIEVDVNEAFIGRVFPGQLVEAQLDAYPDWSIPASVIAIIPTADRAKATVRVRIKITQRDSRILPDMGVKVAFLKSDSPKS